MIASTSKRTVLLLGCTLLLGLPARANRQVHTGAERRRDPHKRSQLNVLRLCRLQLRDGRLRDAEPVGQNSDSSRNPTSVPTQILMMNAGGTIASPPWVRARCEQKPNDWPTQYRRREPDGCFQGRH